MTTPADDRALEAASRLTDTLDLPEWTRPLAGPPEPSLIDTVALPVGGSPGLRLLAEIARIHRAASPVTEPPARPLFHWGHLQVIGPLGQGGYGEVFAAWDPRLQREVALKLVRVQVGTLRWLDEARSLARVHHPNVLTIHGADLRDERAGLWTERVRGRTLEEELTEHGPLAAAEVLRIGYDLSGALAAVHAAGLVHGDLKTSNVMIEDAVLGERDHPPASGVAPSPARRVVLMDFGTASVVSKDDEPGPRRTTPLFAAPEVLAGGAADKRSDVYALGVMLYRLLTARFPVEASDLEGLIAAHGRGQRTPLATRRSDVPAALARIVERATAPLAEARFASAAEFRDVLGALLGQRRRVHPGFLLLTVGALAAAGGLALALDQQLAMRDANRVALPPAPTLALAREPWWATPADTLLSGMGWSLSAADFDHDGRADLLVADAAYSLTQLSQGRAIVFRGGATGLASAPSWGTLGRRSNDVIGAFVTRAGDVDGDGFEDALVRDPNNLMGGPVATGAVLLFRGSAHGLSEAPTQVIVGDTPGPGLGNRIAPAGDVNGDGYADVVVSEHNWVGERRNQGRIRLYLGSANGLPARPSQLLIGEPVSGAFGWDVNGVGDVNHDGFDDVMVGSAWWQNRHGEVGAVDLFFGGRNGLVRAPKGRIIGDRGGDLVGNSQSAVGVGDLNGDGFGDVAIGVAGHDGRGSDVGEVRVYLGRRDGLDPRPAWRAQGYGSSCYLGFNLARPRDVDGDGLADLLVSGYGWSSDRKRPACGAVFLYRGAGPKRLFERRPGWWATIPQSDALFGAGLDLADVDGDGLADVLVGAPHWRNGSIANGRVFAFRGTRGTAAP